mmetsp:Transcript_73544/g.227129  ORF Transcript_73544/g.227129 Transcript_73544/m.227129 type:complete len:229 (-) Transcript_73544:747-1433(-)
MHREGHVQRPRAGQGHGQGHGALLRPVGVRGEDHQLQEAGQRAPAEQPAGRRLPRPLAAHGPPSAGEACQANGGLPPLGVGAAAGRRAEGEGPQPARVRPLGLAEVADAVPDRQEVHPLEVDEDPDVALHLLLVHPQRALRGVRHGRLARRWCQYLSGQPVVGAEEAALLQQSERLSHPPEARLRGPGSGTEALHLCQDQATDKLQLLGREGVQGVPGQEVLEEVLLP